jgi:hypothetical protein
MRSALVCNKPTVAVASVVLKVSGQSCKTAGRGTTVHFIVQQSEENTEGSSSERSSSHSELEAGYPSSLSLLAPQYVRVLNTPSLVAAALRMMTPAALVILKLICSQKMSAKRC